MILEVLDKVREKCIEMKKEEVILYLFADNMIVFIEKS